MSVERKNLIKNDQKKNDPDTILIFFDSRMGSNSARKSSVKLNLGQRTPVHHNGARKSVEIKESGKVKKEIIFTKLLK